LLDVHRWLRDVIDDATMNALFNLEAKLFPSPVDRKIGPKIFNSSLNAHFC